MVVIVMPLVVIMKDKVEELSNIGIKTFAIGTGDEEVIDEGATTGGDRTDFVAQEWESRIIEFGFEFEFEFELDFELEFELDFELEYIKIQQTEYFVMFDKRDQSVLSFIEWYFFLFLLCLHVPQMTPWQRKIFAFHPKRVQNPWFYTRKREEEHPRTFARELPFLTLGRDANHVWSPYDTFIGSHSQLTNFLDRCGDVLI